MPPSPEQHSRGHDYERETQHKLDEILWRQHRDRRTLREVLGLLKQLLARDDEAVSFEVTADEPTEQKD